MKRRALSPESSDADALDELVEALLALRKSAEMRAFLEDLCTPAERQALADRWRVVPYVLAGVPYREIHERTAVSVTTIGRVARCVELGAGGYRVAAEQLGYDTSSLAADAAH